MKKGVVSLAMIMTVGLTMLCSRVSFAASGSWTGASNTLWANDANWSAAPYPSGADTATFNGPGNGNTVIDLSGLGSITAVLFDSTALAIYTLGSGGPKAQNLLLNTGGQIQLGATSWNGQRIDANIQLGADIGGGTYTLRNDNPYQTLLFAGNIAGPASGGTAGVKALATAGVGTIQLAGDLSKGGATSLILTNLMTSGTLVLTGSNTVRTLYMEGAANVGNTVTIAGGELSLVNAGGVQLYSRQGGTINGPGIIRMSTVDGAAATGYNYADLWVASGRTLVINAVITGTGGFEAWAGPGNIGTFELTADNTFEAHVSIGTEGTIRCSKIGNGGQVGNLGKGSRIRFGGSNSKLVYTGAGETNDRQLVWNANGQIHQNGSGHLQFTGPSSFTADSARTITLTGSTEGTGELSGAIGNRSSSYPTSITKSGTGTWTLSGANALAGNILVSAGTLRLAGANGALASATNYTVSANATLRLANTAAANNGNRLGNTSSVTLRGGTLDFAHDAGAANYSETAGLLMVDQGASTVATAQADEGRTSSLTFSALARNGSATINFSGAGLGESDRNRIFIAGQPNGLIGLWATVNGTDLAAYDSTLGVIPATLAGTYRDIAARGPSTITNAPGATIRINTAGVSGPIDLSDTVTTVETLIQNTAIDATVDTAGKTLQLDNIVIPENRAAVTIGSAANDGALMPAQTGGSLLLVNEGNAALTVNASVADNAAAASLAVVGPGPVVLGGSNTLSGTVSISGGTLTLANPWALQNATLATSGLVFDSAVPGSAFWLGALSGAADLALQDNAATPNPVSLTVGGTDASSSHSGTLSGGGSLIKTGSGTLTLSTANTHSGGTSVMDGQITASHKDALGTGPVLVNGILDLSVGNTTYPAMQTSLSGGGTVNVNLATGSNTSYLDGDYSAFTGTWNLGRGTGGGKARMNGPDNPAATIRVLTNGTLWVDNGSTHTAALYLYGGDTGESYGQLRLQNNSTWAGPVYLVNDVTDSADGYFGGPNVNTTGIVSGVISDLNGPHLVQKVTSNSRIYLTNPTNTFGGQIWICGGTLGAVTLRNVGQPSSFGQPADAVAGTIKLGTGSTGVRLTYLGSEDSSTDRILDLATTTGTTYLEQSGDGKVTFTSDLAISGVGNKTLQFEGTGAGEAEFAGVITNGVGSTISISKAGSGTWILSGANGYSGQTTINTGKLIARHPTALGTGSITFPTSSSLELDYNSDGEPPYAVSVSSGSTVTLLLGGNTENGVRHTLGNFTIGNITLNAQAANGVTVGAPALTIPTMNLSAGASGTATISPLDAELHIGSIAILNNSFAKTLKLDGTNAASTVTGCISNGLNTLSLVKDNVSSWTLAGSNTYSGATTVNNGTLRLAGAEGAILGSSGLTLNGGTLDLDNSTIASANRIGDTLPVTLAGGTLSFSHPADAADYTETAGALTVNSGASAIVASQAGAGQTSALTFGSLAYANGVIDFSGAGLGEDARNQVLFANPPALSAGIIGPWATVNGSDFATYGLYGVTAYTGGYTSLAARAGVPNSVVPDDANAHARIAEDGDSGAITVEGDPVSSIGTLTQTHPGYAATVATASKTFRTMGLTVAASAESLTIGAAPEDGTLTALTDGGTLTLRNDSTRTLTVNAAIADNTSASPLTILGSGPVNLGGAVSHTGPTALGNSTLTFSSALPQTLSGVVSGKGTIVKNGTNVLHLLAANTYTGPTYLNTGIVRANQNATFGSSSGGGVFIADGATLDVGCTPDVGGTRINNALDFGAKVITIQGIGYEGMGAIINSSTGSQFNALERLVLAGDARVGGVSRWDVRGGSVLMNGYTLAKAGNNLFGIVDSAVTPGDGLIDVQSGILRLETTTKLNGSSTNTLTVRSGAELEFYQLSNPQGWKLILENASTLDAANNSSASTHNRWAGPIELQGAVTLTGGGSYVADLQGSVTGAGSITKTGSANITISGTNNTYTGSTRISNGTLTIKSLRNVGEPCSLGQPANAADGAIKIGSGTTGATLAYTGSGDVTDRAIDFAGTTGGVTLRQNGSGPLTFTSDIAISGAGDKTLTLRGNGTGAGVIAGRIIDGNTANKITVSKYEPGTWTLAGNNSYVNPTTVLLGELNISGTCACPGEWRITSGFLNMSGTNSQGAGGIFIGYTANSNAVMRVLPGSYITGTGGLRIGNAAGSAGALYLSGGLIDRNPGSADDNNFGLAVANNNTYGYFNMTGGAVTNKRFNIGGTGTLVGTGVARISGGTMRFTEYLLLARTNGCLGVLTLDGGLIDRNGASANFSIAHSGGRGEFNLTGGTLDNSGRAVAVRQNNRGTGSTGVVNICSGTLTLNAFTNDATLGRHWLNFNGGTVRAAANHSAFIPNTMTRVTVNGPFGAYAGGAVIDTAGKNVTVGAPLQAPTGNGVREIILASKGSGYIGEPVVVIDGGGGEGATAVANMEDDGTTNGTYRVASVTITNPGWNYTSAPTVAFVKGGNYVTAPTVGAVLLAPNSSAGLTKQGSGTLTLAAANTYTGSTTVNGGTLQLAHAAALPTGSEVILDGGNLDLGGYTVTNTLTVISGLITNGTLRTVLSPAGEGAIGVQNLALSSAVIQGAYLADVNAAGGSDLVAIQGNANLSGLALTLVNPEALDRTKQYTLMTISGARTGTLTTTNLPDSRWHLVYQSDGAVKLLFIDGTLLKVR